MIDESQISDREREILRLVATGATNQQIAQQLNISINTVKVHLRNIFGKIGVGSRSEATLYAVRAGLVSVERASAPAAVADEPEGGSEPADDDPGSSALPPAVGAPALPAPAEAGALAPLIRASVPPAALDLVPAPALPPESPSFSAALPSAAAGAPAAPAPAPARRLPLLLGIGVIAAVALVIAVILLLRPAPAPAPLPTASASLPDQRWRELAPLPAPRSAFALAGASFDGRSYLYLIGGDDGAAVSDSVLRYDIASNRWVNFRPKPTAVSDVRAVVVGNRIFVPGGRQADGSISTSFEAYDPQRDSWEELAALPAPRSRYALAAVEGKIYLFGGWDGSSYRAEVWQYNPDANSWTAELSAMPAARADAGAAAIDNQILVIGGENEAGRLTINQRYSPAEEQAGNPWSIQAPLPEPRSGAGIAVSIPWIFMIEGGDSSLSFNTGDDAWQPLDIPLDGSLRDLRAATVGSKVYIFGGRNTAGVSDRAYEYLALYTALVPLR